MIFDEIELLLNNAGAKAGYNEKFSVTFSNLPKVCDFQCNDCFAIAKKLGKNPYELAEEVTNAVEENEDFVFEAVRPAFINIKLTDKKLAKIGQEFLKDERGGVPKHSQPQKVIMDYGGANVAKALHIGHLRSPIIGESLKRLYRFLGDEVIADVHLGDWGLQMGLTELQLYLDGHLDYYFKGGKEEKITLEMLNNAYPKASARKNVDEDFKREADDWTLKIQSRQEPYFTIYKKIREVSVKEIKKHYSELGAEFDLWYGESDAQDYIDKAIKIIEDKHLSRVSDGALVVDVAVEGENIPLPKTSEDEVQRYKNPMPPAILKKYNGGVLYATTDIATILMRNEMFKEVDRIEYVVDLRQKNHFTQVFRVCKMAGISPNEQQLVYIGFGTMNGKDGKPFKTRSGDTIKLEDIIDMLVEKASEKLKSNGVEYDKNLALTIGVGAMKFGDLINNVDKDYIFDLDKFLTFEGKTGPYLQYTAVRINSILNKTGLASAEDFTINNEQEREIIKSILKLNSSYEICYNNKSLSPLCLATYNLASAFSTFYNNINVVNEKNESKKKSYIALLMLVKNKLEQALNILAINVPQKM